MAKPRNIPIIDISPYFSDNEQDRTHVVEEVREACSSYGFLQVRGHGVPLSTQRNMLHCCKVLFDLPLDQKDALSLLNNPARRGYERMWGQVLDNKALPDCKEGFYIGQEISADQTGFMRGPNQWPKVPEDEFRAPVTQYREHMLRLTRSLLDMLVIGLGHDPAVLDTFTREPVMNLKLLHYPPHTSEDPLQFGAGAHTDFGTMTVLLQEPGKHGLQVYYAPTEEWLSVPAQEDVLIVNMGDLVQKWTDGKYSSTLHRVINAAGGDRYSVPCFYQGNLSATNPFKPDSGDGETVEQHVRRKFDQSYGLTKE